jgi:uncharacterized membrane protein
VRDMTRSQRSVDDRTRANLALAALALVDAACLANLFMPAGAVRTIVTLLAALVLPGCAVLTHLPAVDLAQGAALMVGLSLTIEVAATLVMVWSGWWHPVEAATIMLDTVAIVLAAGWFRCALGSREAATQ